MDQHSTTEPGTRSAILELIRQHCRANGCGPTIDEISAFVGKSRTAVWYHVNVLVSMGLIQKNGKMPRGIRA